jgi:tRNA-specific 2-thiouridylase
MFVKSIDAKNNTVTVSPYSSLFRSQFVIHSFYFHTLQDMQGELVVKVRYRNQSNICTLQYNSTESITVILQKPLEAIAPGQTAVFYKNNRVVGGGFID